MKSLSVFAKDMRAAFRNPKLFIPMLVVLFIPVLYSGLFLKAFWDPYGKMNELPVAVVNQDKGAQYEGKQLDAGKDLVEELKKTDGFQWNFVSREEAEAGLDDNKYYMAIIVPEDFSSKATTLLDEHPTPAQIVFEPNAGYNFLSAQIGTTAVKDIRTKVSEKVTEAYTESVLDKISEISGGLGEAGSGASKLADGAGKLDEGAAKLHDNLLVLTDGAGKLLDGVQPLTKGVSDLNNGAAQLKTGSGTLASGLQQLSAAHKQLAAGVNSASAGSKKLNAGLQQSLTGAQKLQAGTQSAVEGSAKLQTGAQSVAAGADKLATGLNSAVEGSGQLATGLKASSDGSAKVADAAKSLSQGLQALAQSNPQLAADPNVQKLVAGAAAVAQGSAQVSQSQQQLSAGAAALHSGSQQLAEGAKSLNAGSKQLAAGIDSLHSGAVQLNTGAGQLAQGQKQLSAGASELTAGFTKLNAGMTQFGTKLGEAAAGGSKLAQGGAALEAGTSKLLSGAGQLSGGISSLADGSQKLADGAGELKTGADQLKDGSKELATKLGDAATQTANVKKTDEMVSMFAEPVQVETKTLNAVPNYGTGFTPYFLSLGLFVGALICTIVVPMRESEAEGATRFNRFMSRTLTFTGMSLIQSLLAALIVLYGLKLEVHSKPLFFLFTFVTGLTFMWIIQALVTWLDQPGRFVAIVLLIFQLTTSAGTFPLELIPNWMKGLNPLLPMTYSVRGFKSVISTGDYSAMWSDLGILAIFAVGFLALTLIYFLTRNRDTQAGVKSEQVMNV
ncbi:YhgE/Pip domain-containing protein [Paenibacillus spiritus]|uniref:YhgE/Pip domain-containing protein n=1 Tax=Paenibacillus spiritus TaxID=2496557 RepID=A0A5J5GAG9_9BACL|nr:YhgE/Pip domain-containing protein [Paenibacillus spiritus]KAA9004802.1 YhgE/Pip domain-containing protein [Paenibacillus spiritus]